MYAKAAFASSEVVAVGSFTDVVSVATVTRVVVGTETVTAVGVKIGVRVTVMAVGIDTVKPLGMLTDGMGIVMTVGVVARLALIEIAPLPLTVTVAVA